MNALNLKLYAILKNDVHLSDAKAQEYMQTLDELMQQNIKKALPEYQSILKEDMLRMEMTLRAELKDVEVKIKDSKVDTIKWMVGLFITLALMILGLYIKK